MSAASSRIYAIYVLSSLVNVAHLSPIWNYSESPDDVFWAFDCNFPEGDFANIKSMGEQCGLLCRTTSRCTHFTWTNYEGGTCWMKTGDVSREKAIYASGRYNNIVCGYLNKRTPDPIKPLKWEERAIGIRQSTGCDFPGKPFQIRQNSNPHDCETSCQHTPGCSNFVWFQNGTCFLKSGPASEDIAQVGSHGPNTVCGYLFIAWNNNSQSKAWAPNCDFPTETFKRISAPGKECGPLCWRNAPCNHFTFTNFTGEGGMCLLKTGNNSRTLAIRRTPDELGKGSFCGFYQENIMTNVRQSTKDYTQRLTTAFAHPTVNPNQDQCDCECP